MIFCFCSAILKLLLQRFVFYLLISLQGTDWLYLKMEGEVFFIYYYCKEVIQL